MSTIAHFRGAHAFLSNFAPSPVVLDGVTYPTVEHAFQAAKTFDADEREQIRDANTPPTAKRLGRKVALRADWEQVKFGIMRDLLRQKFAIPELRQALLDTGDAELIEGNNWNDRTWGKVLMKGQWVGKNWLGDLMMAIRTDCRG